MADTTGTIQFYNSFKERMVEDMNLGSDTFIIGLVTSSYTFSAAHTQLSDITNEVSGNGYARQTLGSVTSSQSGGTYTFDFANPVFTASGGSITARRYFIFNNTLSGDPLVCSGLLNNADADVETTNGNTLTFQVNASGLFTLA
jgi:hypothetical protein